MQLVKTKSLSVAGNDDLNSLVWQIDTRIAALFKQYDVQLSADCSNWTAATRQLAIELSRKHTPWLTHAIKDCCAWTHVSVLVREFHPQLFKTETEIKNSQSGRAGTFKNKAFYILDTVDGIERVTKLSKKKVCLLLENVTAIEPLLFVWADSQKKEMPTELTSVCGDLWPNLQMRNREAMRDKPENVRQKKSSDLADKRTQKMHELATQLKYQRIRLAEFKEKFPAPKNLEDNLKRALRFAREKPREFKSLLFSHGNWLPKEIEQTLDSVPKYPERMRTIARLCQPGADLTPPPPGVYVQKVLSTY